MRFHKVAFLWAWLVFLADLQAQSTQDEQVILENYTLAQCIDYALKNSNSIKNAQLDIKIAEAQVRQTAADGLPQINGNLNILHNYKVPKSFLPAQLVDPQAPAGEFIPVEFQPALNGQALFSMNQLLFDGTFFTALRASKVYKQLSVRQLDMTKNDLIANVSQAYYMVLINRERQSLLDANIARLESLHQETSALYENGMVEKLDVDRITVSLNSLKAEKQKLMMAVNLSMEFLKFQVGLRTIDQMTVGEKLSDVQFEATENLASLASEKFQYSQRPEFQLLQTQKELNTLNVQRYKSGYYPSVSFFVDYGWNSGTNDLSDYVNFGEFWFGNGKYGLAFQIPVFDGFRKKSLIQQNRLELEKTQRNLLDMKRNIDLQITQSAGTLQANLEILEARKQNAELAKEVYRITQVKYREGVGSNLEIMEAENALKQAETDYYTALYDALLAQIDLRKALGTLGK